MPRTLFETGFADPVAPGRGLGVDDHFPEPLGSRLPAEGAEDGGPPVPSSRLPAEGAEKEGPPVPSSRLPAEGAEKEGPPAPSSRVPASRLPSVLPVACVADPAARTPGGVFPLILVRTAGAA